VNAEFPIVVEPDVIPALSHHLASQRGRALTLVADSNTYEALGRRVFQALQEQNVDVRLVILEGPEVAPDEHRIMQVLVEAGNEERTYLAVGSGVITDIVRFVSHRTRTEFYSFPTAPSVDGYTSVSASLVVGRLKRTIYAQPPAAIFGDLDTLCSAPRPMIAAGFGDVLAKYTSIADWTLAHLLWDTPYDAQVAQRTRQARDACVQQVDQIVQASPAGIRALFGALVETGLCMLAVGASYPAGGSEHYISHYWEMKLLQENRPAILHGAKVGVGTVLAARYYDQIGALTRDQAASRLAATPMPDPERDAARIRAAYWDMGKTIVTEQLPFLGQSASQYAELQARILDHWNDILAIAAEVPSPGILADWLHQVDGPISPAGLGLSREEADLALEVSHFLRNRFTVFKLSRMLGLLS
jgi:glycerol-1-phosphate dehydrogenase [NAD(P)+]